MARRFVGPINILIDAFLVALSLFAAIALRYDGAIPPNVLRNYLIVVPWICLVSVVALRIAGAHRIIWRYAGLHAVVDITKALSVTSLAFGVVNLLPTERLFPRSIPLLFWVLQVVFVGGARIAGRLSRVGERRRTEPTLGERSDRKRVLVFGAGDVGETLVRDLLRGGRFDWDPVGFVDDDRTKLGRTIHGLVVRGTTLEIPRLIRQYDVDEVVIAAPSAPSTLVASIFRCCQQEGISCKTVPSLADYVVGKSPLAQVREVRIEDLLGREPVDIDLDEVSGFLRGRAVLVTGAGGSIGSELCRQIAKFEPSLLVALDHDENKLCYMSLDLRREYPELALAVVVEDVKERVGIAHALTTHRPHVIFHAAAHKHVSFMEDNPRAAILNNVLGTRVLAEEAIRHGVRNFVLISTDKAVNPTNVMGASKRLCEKVVTALAAQGSGTHFNSVRFGNVLGSEGSVIPIFRKQIAAGGPVTITHPEARRFFMTIPEASQLVIQAGAFGQSGTVFVLDMGEQVKVLEVARQLIRLSGFEPDRDIAIRFIGLRPGEKLYEELLTDSERTTASMHRKIFIWRSDTEEWSSLGPRVDSLLSLTDRAAPREIKAALAALVPEYRVDCPVVALDEVPELEASVPTRSIDDHSALPHEHRPLFDPPILAAVRGLARVAFSLPSLLLIGGLTLAHVVAAPGAPVFVRDARIGRNRRAAPRRLFSNRVPIERRGRDRRRTNLYGQPFLKLRFNTTPRARASRMERSFYGFLRHRGLDRLPSVLHLLTGEMAMVGPSAESAETIDRRFAAVANFRRRFVIRPGITGLAQLVAEGVPQDPREAEKVVRIDKFYVAHRTLGMDLRILTRSFAVVLAGSKREPHRLRDRLGVTTPPARRLDALREKY